MTSFLFNLMILAIVVLKMLVMLLILNWINREPKKDYGFFPIGSPASRRE